MTPDPVTTRLARLRATRHIDQRQWDDVLDQVRQLQAGPYGTRMAVAYLTSVEREARRKKEQAI